MIRFLTCKVRPANQDCPFVAAGLQRVVHGLSFAVQIGCAAIELRFQGAAEEPGIQALHDQVEKSGRVEEVQEVEGWAVLEDFALELIVFENQCFGSAGGTTTVEPDLAVLRSFGGGDYTLIYEIHGGEDGTETYNLDIHDDGTYTKDQERINTANCSDELTVEPVRLVER